MSEMPTSEDPCDGIDLNNLDGWTRYDSSRMRKTDNGEGLEGIKEIDIKTLGYALIMVEAVKK